MSDAINYNQIFELLSQLGLTIYTPSTYILPSRLAKYVDADDQHVNLTMRGREKGIRRLMAINLLKRLESSVASFKLTIDRIRSLISQTIDTIEGLITKPFLPSAKSARNAFAGPGAKSGKNGWPTQA